MKTFLSLGLFSLGLLYQLAVSAATTKANTGVQHPRLTPHTKAPWQATKRTATQTRWESVTTYSNFVTRKVTFTTNSYVELGSGLNVPDAQGGFSAARPEFTITATGAEATGGAHQIVVPGDIGRGEGIKIITPNGSEVVLQPLGINYFDPVDGRSILVDWVTNSVGWLISSNEIVFSNCFTHLKASIRLRNTLGGFESDLILHERPPDPESLGLSSSARLEMLTEQLDGPAPTQKQKFISREKDPAKRNAMADPDFSDTELGFGGMKMIRGRAFATPFSDKPGDVSALPSRVGKSYLNIGGRNIFIEAVEHRRVRDALNRLPPTTKKLNLRAGLLPGAPLGRLALNTRPLPPVVKDVAPSTAIRHSGLASLRPETTNSASLLAAARLEAPAFVLDYYAVNEWGETDFTFRGDTTYKVIWTPLYGTTTIEGGTVIKFDEYATLSVNEEDTVVCDTSNYLPAIFTCLDDDSVGEVLPDSDHDPEQYTWTSAFYFMKYDPESTVELSNVRFSHLGYPIFVEGGAGPTITLRNVQVRDAAVFLETGGTTINIFNGLFVDCGLIYEAGETVFRGEHLTVHNATELGYSWTPGTSSAGVKNCLFIDVQNAPNNVGTYEESHCTTLSGMSASGVFDTTAGGGEHYLASGTYRDNGDPNIDSELKSALRQMTTIAPFELSGTVTADQMLMPRAIRDTGDLDRGYHYPAVDYAAKGWVLNNCTATLKGGVVVGAAPSANWAAISYSPGTFISVGTPVAMNRLIRLNQVQENVETRVSAILSSGYSETIFSELRLRFTEISSLNSEGYLFYLGASARKGEASHSSFFNGSIQISMYDGVYQTVGLTNNLFRSVGSHFSAPSSAYFYCYNNLFKDGLCSLYGGNSSWVINDNVFDTCTRTIEASTFNNDRNAYVGTRSGDQDPFPNEQEYWQLDSIEYGVGPLGRFYMPSYFVDAGSRDADDAGLFHFASQTSQDKEEDSLVDIGLHYVALDDQYDPLDFDEDGVPDYLEDTNGNGVFDDGVDLSDWESPNCPRDIYEDVLDGQNPSAWFKLNNSLADNEGGSALGNPNGGTWDADTFANGSSAFSFTSTGNDERLTAGDLINGGDGSSQGSLSLLFRSLTGVPTTRRFVFCQRGKTSTDTAYDEYEFSVFIEEDAPPANPPPANPGSLNMQIGGQGPVEILPANAVVPGAWYYLAITWDETRDAAPEVKWYLGPVGRTLTSGTINLGNTKVVGNNETPTARAVHLGNREGQNRSLRSPGSGALDEIVFWNRELTGTEVNAQFDTLNTLFQGPSKVFDLTRWELTLPVDNQNQLDNTHLPLDISRAWLNSGFQYVDPVGNDCTKKYFYRDANTMVFEVPYDGADQDTDSPLTKLGSPRSELRGRLANGDEDNWTTIGTHILEGTCTVNEAGDDPGAGGPHPTNDRKVIIGQIHEKSPTSVASIAVNYNFPNAGDVSVTVKDKANGTDNGDAGIEVDRNFTLATGVALGATIHYKLELVGITGTSLILKATCNGGTTETITMYQNGDGTWNDSTWLTSLFYYKAGCYFPTTPGGTAKVTFTSLSATHP